MDNVARMNTLTIQLDEDAARMVEEASKASNQPLEQWLRENICQAATRTMNPATPSPSQALTPLNPDYDPFFEEFAPDA
jgi:hypothetical protein